MTTPNNGYGYRDATDILDAMMAAMRNPALEWGHIVRRMALAGLDLVNAANRGVEAPAAEAEAYHLIAREGTHSLPSGGDMAADGRGRYEAERAIFLAMRDAVRLHWRVVKEPAIEAETRARNMRRMAEILQTTEIHGGKGRG